MVVKYLGDSKYIALAADTKPTNAATNAELWQTDPTIFYLAAVDSSNGFRYRIGNNDASALITADIPTQFTQLNVYVGIANTAAASKTIDCYAAYIKQDGM